MTVETIPSELTAESLYAGTFTTNVTATGVDIRDYIGKIKVVLDASAAANDNQAVNVSLETSNELSANYVAFDPALAFANIAANGAAQLQQTAIDTRLARRYVRAVLTRAAAGNGRAVSVTITGKKQVTA